MTFYHMHDLLFSYLLGMWSSLCKEYFSDNFATIIWRKKTIPAIRNGQKKKVYGWLNSLSVWSSRKKQKHLCSCMDMEGKKCLPYLPSIEAGTLVRATAALPQPLRLLYSHRFPIGRGFIEAGGWSREEPGRPLSLFFQDLAEDQTSVFHPL